MVSAFAFALDDERDAHAVVSALAVGGSDDDDALQVALAFVDDFQAPAAAAVIRRNDGDEAFAQLEFDGDTDLIFPSDLADFSFLDDALAAMAASHVGGAGASTSALRDDGAIAQVVEAPSDSAHAYYQVAPVGARTAVECAIAPPVSISTFDYRLNALATTATGRTAKLPTVKKTADKTHRKRTKEELEYLRKQVQELEQCLKGLRTQSATAAHDGAVSSFLQSSLDDSVADGDAMSVLTECRYTNTALVDHSHLWKRITEHQLSEKQKAEVENQKLKHVLESQLKIAQSLSKLLRKRPDVSWLSSQQLGSQKKLRINVQSGERGVFEELSERVETLYDQSDDVFLDTGLKNMNAELQDGIVKSDDLGSMFLEVVDAKILPFDVRTIAAAMWKIMSKPSMAVSNGVYQAIDVTEDTVRAQYSVTVRLRRSEVPIHMRLVYRRIIEASRVVFVWCSEGKSKNSLSGRNGHLNVRQSGWSVIEQVATGSSTIMKSVLRMTPEVENTLSSTKRSYHVGMFTDIVLSGFHHNLTIVHQNVENLIVSEQLLSASG